MKLKSSRGWSEQQEGLLIKYFNSGMSDGEISLLLTSKTEDAVRNKIKRMGLVREVKKMKILLLDIETAPLTVHSWGIFDQNINIDAIKSDWFILCWSAKWLGEDEVISSKLTKSESLKMNDSRIVKEIWKLLNSADAVVGHNSNKFDLKRLNTRFMFHGLPMPTNYRKIDTLVIAKKYFNVSSNKLDYLCRFLGLPTKISTGGFQLWLDCMKGNEEALNKMSEYCENDVRILEELYLKLRPYDGQHPNVNIFNDVGVVNCCNCGSTGLKPDGQITTNAGIYKTYRCECGALTKSKENEKTKRNKNNNTLKATVS